MYGPFGLIYTWLLICPMEYILKFNKIICFIGILGHVTTPAGQTKHYSLSVITQQSESLAQVLI